jgi:hypothetical protein
VNFFWLNPNTNTFATEMGKRRAQSRVVAPGSKSVCSRRSRAKRTKRCSSLIAIVSNKLMKFAGQQASSINKEFEKVARLAPPGRHFQTAQVLHHIFHHYAANLFGTLFFLHIRYISNLDY